MKISEGIEQDNIVVGNNYDKYQSRNPIARWMVGNFEKTLTQFVTKVSPKTIHEVGCGEGYWVLNWTKQGINARGSDFSEKIINIAKENAEISGAPSSIFNTKSIYNIEREIDTADLIVCCEVLEHIEKPQEGLKALASVAREYVILSVPREPIWCALNLIRGKYISRLGNTPGHIQHWSSRAFINEVSQHFDILEVKKPLPWTMLLCRVRR
jgi:2-polyprenyl-3-methyl-5-hydroxy-6-metoxy-1,4-benzoquinol methylase